jgi:hypothetical protein
MHACRREAKAYARLDVLLTKTESPKVLSHTIYSTERAAICYRLVPRDCGPALLCHRHRSTCQTRLLDGRVSRGSSLVTPQNIFVAKAWNAWIKPQGLTVLTVSPVVVVNGLWCFALGSPPMNPDHYHRLSTEPLMRMRRIIRPSIAQDL